MKLAVAILCVFATSTLYVLAKSPKDVSKYLERDDEAMKECKAKSEFTDEDEQKIKEEFDTLEDDAVVEILKKINNVFECVMHKMELVNDKNEIQPAKVHEMVDAEMGGEANATMHEKIDECIEEVSNASEKSGFGLHFTACLADKFGELED